MASRKGAVSGTPRTKKVALAGAVRRRHSAPYHPYTLRRLWTRHPIIRPALFDALRCRHGEARQRADQSAGKRRSSGKSANAVLL